MIDRKIQPGFGQQWRPEVLNYERFELQNGMPLYMLPSSHTQGALKIDLVLGAGTGISSQKGVASAASNLFTEGTTSMSSAQIHEAFDFYGSYIERECTADDVRISLYGLRTFLPNILRLLSAILSDACFPESEVALYKNRQKQKLTVNLQKNAFVAKRLFGQQLWGNNHPYGRNMSPEDYNNLGAEQIRAFFKRFYTPKNAYLIVSGSVVPDDLPLINSCFGELFCEKMAATATPDSVSWHSNQQSGLLKYLKPDSMQTAIRLGCQTVDRKHQDYVALQVLNTLLGGYFGSRLMRSIREEKGLTYGIGSSISSLKNGSYWGVQTEVIAEKWEEALLEIKNQVVTLQQNAVSLGELSLVKNYMLGSFGRMFDGVFAKADRLKTLIDHNLPPDYYVTYADAVSQVTPDILPAIAKQYFDTNAFTEIVV